MTPEFGSPRTAIVTGGARRIGAEMVRALAADGWHVLIHCNRSRGEAEALRAEVGNATIVAADLSRLGAYDVVMEAARELPPVALLINNASIFQYDESDSFDADSWDRHLDTNLRAPALLSQAFARAVKGSGLIVNMLDVKLFALNPDYFSYTVSKYGLMGLTELQARAMAPKIRVCGIAPAVTLVSGPQSRDNFEAAHTHNPLKRGVTVEDIVRTLRYVIATPTLTGEIITVDGGQRLMGMPRDVAFMVEQK